MQTPFATTTDLRRPPGGRDVRASVRVKICGLTNEADARFAAEAGADYLGFVFASASPRYIAPDTLASFAGRLPPHAKKVGVFVDAAPEEISSVRDLCGLDVVQLHGRETRAVAARLGAGGEVWRALALTGPEALREAETFDGFTILADNERGGGRRSCDHATARILAATTRLFLAGGLDASNVAAAIRAVRPFGVDAASRLESAPGQKDPDKVRTFIETAKRSIEP
jgi:phosphoribosylanthranilate isomerase